MAAIVEPSSNPYSGVGQEQLAVLIAAYHASARDELIHRIERRDGSIYLYLAAIAAIFSVAIANYPSNVIMLLVIPFLGLGASLIHTEHNTVIGALGAYLAVELDSATHLALSGRVPLSWNSSVTLRELHAHIGARFYSSVILIVGPSALSIGAVAYTVEFRPLTLTAIAAGLVLMSSTVWALWDAHDRRGAFDANIREALGRRENKP